MMCFGLKDRKRLKTNHCVIVLLDDTQLVHELHPSSTGQDLLDVVIKHLNLLETSYFGLKYYLQQQQQANSGGGEPVYQPQYGTSASARQPIWLDVDKSAIKQLRHTSPMTVYFGVKYYATDPCKLAEEITRYQFFLQCKRDILQARLPINFELAVELFALAIQSELGDFDPGRHHENYASEFAFVPQQTLELEQAAALIHRQQLIGQVPARAELNFLEKIKWLDMYGCELHPIQYDEGDQRDQYALGLNPSGVLVLRNKLKVAQYAWARIVKTKCQGRCFLMDVIETGGVESCQGGGLELISGSSKRLGAGLQRNRFGFRLADKEASRRLRWSLEEHKQFFHLVSASSSALASTSAVNSNNLAQLARRQQQQAAAAAAAAEQQLKLSQRFRNSIRSAINLSAHFQQQQQAQQFNQQMALQQHRSSVKSMRNYSGGDGAASRPPPMVVRMPSRRYSNRSLPRSSTSNGNNYNHQLLIASNGNGLPAAPAAAEMAASQHNQHMLMMSTVEQQQQQLRSQTLRPISSKEAKQRGMQSNGQYYQMMMLMAAQQQQQQSQSMHGGGKRQQLAPEVSILPPGQHIVQPAIYRASSVVDGVNQLGSAQQQQLAMGKPASMMQQFFNTPARYQSGRESPRSTKSAMVATSSAMLKLASKKLAKQQQQQQQLLYGGGGGKSLEARPLLAYAAEPHMQQIYSNNANDFYHQSDLGAPGGGSGAAGAFSASGSPRSARHARSLSAAAKYRSKSTGENLHLLHQQAPQMVRGASNKMLLATALPHDQQQQQQLVLASMLPPPDYNSSGTTPLPSQQQYASSTICAKGNRIKKLPPPPPLKLSINTKLALEQQQRRNNGFSARKQQQQQQDEEDENYYCSRSDCSSIDDGGGVIKRRHQPTKQHQDVVGQQQQQDWAAIRKRHNEFSHGKGPLGRLDQQQQQQQMIETQKAARQQQQQQQQFAKDTNNNLCADFEDQRQQPALKNIANKQATPILLSMNQAFSEQQMTRMNPNSKAVQLLNLQRQQLNSQSSEVSASRTATNTTGSSNSATDSAPSSVASSPKAAQPPLEHNQSKASPLRLLHHNAADSTASNSTTTSGYYAGSNSTGPASVDSDTLLPAPPSESTGKPSSRQQQQQNQARNLIKTNWTPNTSLYAEGTRAKIALGVHGNPSASGGMLLSANRSLSRPPKHNTNQQRFYLGETTSIGHNSAGAHSESEAIQSPGFSKHQQQQQHWAHLEQLQQQANGGAASLKYVSFDV